MKISLRRLLGFLAPFVPQILLAIGLGVATIACGIGLMGTSAYLIATAALHPSVAALGVAIVGVRFFGVARGVLRYVERLVTHDVTFRLLAQLRVWFYAALEPLAPAQLLRQRSGDLLTRISADIDTLQYLYARAVAPPVVAVLTTLATWFFLSRFDIAIANAVLGFLVLAGVVLPLITLLLSRHLSAQIIALRADLNATLVDGMQGLADLVAFGQHHQYATRVEALGGRLAATQRRSAVIAGLHAALMLLLTHLALFTTVLLAIPLVATGQLAGVLLGMLALVTQASFEAVTPLPAALQNLGTSIAAAERLFALVDIAPAIVTPAHPAVPSAHPTLVVNDLSFRYDADAPNVLSHLSFTLAAGECLVLVGPSGAGKTTLANLLLRFWDYDDGQILLAGTDLRAFAPEDVRRMIGLVSQETHLFNATIRQNLVMARPAATDQEVLAAARKAQLHDRIVSMPQGYDTPIGEQGLRLSGGERQRLSIARALIHNAPILILDEPTAHLDAANDHAVMQALTAAMDGRATILITHQQPHHDLADKMLFLDSGKMRSQAIKTLS